MGERLDEIQQTRLAERVRLSVRGAILDGTFRPGERLFEEEIARQVGLSRSPVREAIRLLQQEGLVASFPRRGAFVIELTARDAEEVYALRAALEALAARLLWSEPDRSLDELDEIVDDMERCASRQDVQGLSDLDVLFHGRLVEACGNQRVLRAWNSLLGQVELLSRKVIDSLYAELSTVPERHRAVVDVIRGSSVTDIDGVISEHIQSVAERIVPQLESRKGDATALEA